jgi:hypothetical protein
MVCFIGLPMVKKSTGSGALVARKLSPRLPMILLVIRINVA